jgi:hypothetical protein
METELQPTLADGACKRLLSGARGEFCMNNADVVVDRPNADPPLDRQFSTSGALGKRGQQLAFARAERRGGRGILFGGLNHVGLSFRLAGRYMETANPT